MTILLRLFQIIEEGGVLPNSIYEAKITLTIKPDKNTIRKRYYRSIYLIDLDEKILN